LAAFNSRSRSDAGLNLFREGFWPGAVVGCLRNNTSAMGKSAIDGAAFGRTASSPTQLAREYERDALAALLRFSGEPKPLNLSQQLLAGDRTLHDLLTYGSLDRIIPQLSSNTRHMLELVRQTLEAALSVSVFSAPIVASSKVLHDMLKHEMGKLRCERLRVLYLNSAKLLVADRILADGGINSVRIEPREIIREALLCDATDLIVVHNHPSNCSQPSQSDLRITSEIRAAAALCNINLLDHLIVTRSGVCSLRAEGFFDHNLKSLSQGGLV
jgi:DNA repair protein RadC